MGNNKKIRPICLISVMTMCIYLLMNASCLSETSVKYGTYNQL